MKKERNGKYVQFFYSMKAALVVVILLVSITPISAFGGADRPEDTLHSFFANMDEIERMVGSGSSDEEILAYLSGNILNLWTDDATLHILDGTGETLASAVGIDQIEALFLSPDPIILRGYFPVYGHHMLGHVKTTELHGPNAAVSSWVMVSVLYTVLDSDPPEYLSVLSRQQVRTIMTREGSQWKISNQEVTRLWTTFSTQFSPPAEP